MSATCADCGTTLPEQRMWCRSCTARRQEAAALGLPAMTPVGVVLQDFEAPVAQCACGGDLTMPLHTSGLTHRIWAQRQHPALEVSPAQLKALRDAAGQLAVEALQRPDLPNTK